MSDFLTKGDLTSRWGRDAKVFLKDGTEYSGSIHKSNSDRSGSQIILYADGKMRDDIKRIEFDDSNEFKHQLTVFTYFDTIPQHEIID